MERLTAIPPLVTEAEPHPHILLDDVIGAVTIRRLLEFWPARPNMTQVLPLNYICSGAPGTAPFFDYAARFVIEPLARACLTSFAPLLIARFGENDLGPITCGVTAMESDPGCPGHPSHTHYWHSPHWIFTMLIYLDEEAVGHPGTDMNVCAPDAAAALAGRPVVEQTAGSQTVVKTVGYRAGRLFALLEGPANYHGVRKSSLDAIGKRRILRSHVMVSPDKIERVYGVTHEQWRRAFDSGQSGQSALNAWAVRDIRSQALPPQISTADAVAWSARVALGF